MSQRATIALVMKRKNKGEHDQVLTLFTKRYGKIEFMCRGIRKKEAKLAGHLGLLCLSDISFVLGKYTKVLTSACNREHFAAIKKDLMKLRAARRIIKLLDTYTITEAKDEAIFNLVVGALDYLNRREMTLLEIKFFLRYFEFKFLSLLGYEPEDKTIMHAFGGQEIKLSEEELDVMEEIFDQHFRDIYGTVKI
ncbi:MAG: DNA repair protein RecO [Candidatus Azambacteria bacterium]|nr:DNA repair protein RecO [Candidatus Azambacteria bacterium]